MNVKFKYKIKSLINFFFYNFFQMHLCGIVKCHQILGRVVQLAWKQDWQLQLDYN